MPFWFPRCVDTVNGGYTVHYGPKGEVLGGGVKMIVTQARQLWLASALLRSRYAHPRPARRGRPRLPLPARRDVGQGQRRLLLAGRRHRQAGDARPEAPLRPGLRHLRRRRVRDGDGQQGGARVRARRLPPDRRQGARRRPRRLPRVLRRRLERGAGRRYAAARRPGRPQVDEHPPAPARGVGDAAARQRGSAGARAPDRAGQHRDARGGARRLDGAHRSAPGRLDADPGSGRGARLVRPRPREHLAGRRRARRAQPAGRAVHRLLQERVRLLTAARLGRREGRLLRQRPARASRPIGGRRCGGCRPR